MKAYLLDEGYLWIPKRKDFDEDPKEEIQGKSKFSSLGGVLGTSYQLDYASRCRDPSYSGFSLHIFADFWVKMVERVKGLFGQKKEEAQNLTFFAYLGEGGLRLGKGELGRDELEASFQAVFYLA